MSAVLMYRLDTDPQPVPARKLRAACLVIGLSVGLAWSVHAYAQAIQQPQPIYTDAQAVSAAQSAGLITASQAPVQPNDLSAAAASNLAAMTALAPSLAPVQTVNGNVGAVTVSVPTVPSTCASVQSADTLNGTAGSGSPCIPRVDAARPTLVQRVNTATTTGGAWSVTFAKTFVSATPTINVLPLDPSGNTIICKTQARSATGASGVCATTQTTLLNLSIVTAGLTVNPVTTSAVGLTVMVIGAEPTQ